MIDDDDNYIGKRIRELRRVRGWSQQFLADKAGIDRSIITKYERGTRALDSRAAVYSLAQALCVSVADLTGQLDDNIAPSVAKFRKAIPDIEAALMAAGELDEAAPPAPLTELSATADQALAMRLATDYGELGSLLPGLITDLYRHTHSAAESDRIAAWDGLARATYAASLETKSAGNLALAWLAAQVTAEAAELVGNPAYKAAADFCRSQVLLATPGRLTAALAYSERSADTLQRELTTQARLKVYGMLHLQSALTAAALGKNPADHMREADETAAQLTQRKRSSDDAESELQSNFCAENVAVWRMSVAVEQRDGGAAIEYAKTVVPQTIPTETRQSQYFIELGRAHALKKDYRSSMHALLRAEHIAPQKVRGRAVVRELVGYMLRQARRDLITSDLGTFAKRVGAVA